MNMFRKIAVFLAQVVFVIACILAGIKLFFWWFATQNTFSPVDQEHDRYAESFPVAVVYYDEVAKRNAVEVVLMKDLASTTAAHPNYSLLIPEGEERSLNAYTDIHDRGLQNLGDFSANTPYPWTSGFTVERSGERGQRIKAWRTEDDDWENTGWYTATKDKMTPERHRVYFGGGAGIFAIPVAILSVIVGFIVLAVAKRAYRRRHPVAIQPPV